MDLPTFNERNLGQILHHNEIAGQAALLHQVAAHFFLAQLCIKDAVIRPSISMEIRLPGVPVAKCRSTLSI